MSSYQCPVCGYAGLQRPARSASGSASFEICECCNFQFGYDDDDQGVTYDQWRTSWVNQGMRWNDGDSSPPPDWDPKAQLASLDLD